jgi:hypothetical protein
MGIPTPTCSGMLLAVFVLAVLIRISFVQVIIGFDKGAQNPGVLNGDERDYIGRAQNLLAGNGLTAGGARDRMWRTPGYPGFLAGLFTLGGKSVAVIRLAQCMLGGLVCVLLFLLARQLFDRRLAMAAALYFALFPPHAYMAGMILSENLLLPAVLGSILAFLSLAKAQTFRSAILAGALAGVSILIKPESAIVPGAFVLTIWNLRIRNKAGLSLAIALIAALVLSPWLIRNHRLSGHFVLSSVGGEAFWGGNNKYVLDDPKYRGYWMTPSEMPAQFDEVLAAPTEYEQDRVRWRLGKDFLDQHRGDLPRLAIYKLRRFYSVFVQDPKERLALILSFGLLLPSIAAGVVINGWRFLRERHSGLVLIGIILGYNLLAIIFWGANRMRLVIDPFLILFGVWAVRAALFRIGLLTEKVGAEKQPDSIFHMNE